MTSNLLAGSTWPCSACGALSLAREWSHGSQLWAPVRRYDCARLVAGRQQHLFRTQVDFDRGVRTVAENGLTGGIGTKFRPSQRFPFHELLRFGGFGKRHG